MPHPARVLPDDYDPDSAKQKALRAGYRKALRHDDDPTPEQLEANSAFAAWKRKNPSGRANTHASAVAEVEPFRPDAIDRVAEQIGQPHFELTEPPIGHVEPVAGVASAAIIVDQLRLELVECERANRHQVAELRGEIRKLTEQLELAQEAVRQAELERDRVIGDTRAYAALAAIPALDTGVTIRAYITDPSDRPASPERQNLRRAARTLRRNR